MSPTNALVPLDDTPIVEEPSEEEDVKPDFIRHPWARIGAVSAAGVFLAMSFVSVASADDLDKQLDKSKAKTVKAKSAKAKSAKAKSAKSAKAKTVKAKTAKSARAKSVNSGTTSVAGVRAQGSPKTAKAKTVKRDKSDSASVAGARRARDASPSDATSPPRAGGIRDVSTETSPATVRGAKTGTSRSRTTVGGVKTGTSISATTVGGVKTAGTLTAVAGVQAPGGAGTATTMGPGEATGTDTDDTTVAGVQVAGVQAAGLEAADIAEMLGGGITADDVEAMSPEEIQGVAVAAGIGELPMPEVAGVQAGPSDEAQVAGVQVGQLPLTGDPRLASIALLLAAAGGAGLYLRRRNR